MTERQVFALIVVFFGLLLVAAGWCVHSGYSGG